MRPTITVALDEDKAKVGRVAATWPDGFNFSRRLNGDKEGSVGDFVTDAQAAHTEWTQREARQTQLANRITERFPEGVTP
jgi:hypothetical protein